MKTRCQIAYVLYPYHLTRFESFPVQIAVEDFKITDTYKLKNCCVSVELHSIVNKNEQDRILSPLHHWTVMSQLNHSRG